MDRCWRPFRFAVPRLISSRQLDFPSCMEFIVLDDSLPNNVLLPFLSHSSQGCTLDFSADVLSGREGMEKLFSDTMVH